MSRLVLVAMLAASLPASLAAPNPASAETRPLLATPAQIVAEQQLLALTADPEVKAAQARLHAELAASDKSAASPDAAARIDYAIAQWTNSLIFKEIAAYRAHPAVIWGTDDTSRTWLGHTVGGTGSAGDNPDNIYRLAAVDGSGSYELTGRINLAHRPSQFSIEVIHGDVIPDKLLNQNAGHADFGNQLAMITDKDLVLDAKGNFRVTFGGTEHSANHVDITPGPVTIGFRDTLSDWRQRPASLTIRPLGATPAQPYDPAELRRRVLTKLEPYVRFWAGYTSVWFGGLKPNSYAGPVARDGGWGYVAGMRFQLAADEGLLVTTTRGGAAYTGFQVVDPWMIASDSRSFQGSLNLTQAKANADGSYTYVIAARDPGIANWIDTAGLHDGYAVIRWQNLPKGSTGKDLLRDFRVVKLADVAALQGVPLATAQDRKAAIAERAVEYNLRVR